MSDASLLQALKLKGRASPAALAIALGRSEEDVAAAVDGLVASGHAEPTSMGVKLTDAGRNELAHVLNEERAGLDQSVLDALYGEFAAVNDEFKRVVTSWQMKSDTEFNNHSDADYDQGVLDRLVALDRRFRPIAERAATLVPRLATYPPRFAAAIERVRAGDTDYIAKPLIDSYHTVWFEFHEELIQASGRNRADEAAAGRGA